MPIPLGPQIQGPLHFPPGKSWKESPAYNQAGPSCPWYQGQEEAFKNVIIALDFDALKTTPSYTSKGRSSRGGLWTHLITAMAHSSSGMRGKG